MSDARPRASLPGALTLLLVLLAVSPAAAQEPEPLERFLAQVSRLWSAGDAGALARLAPADGRILLSLEGDAAAGVPARHAAARLRSYFATRETVSARPVRASVSGGSPLRGFGEISWSYRSRGISDRQNGSVFVGVVSEEGSWRIRELRLIQ